MPVTVKFRDPFADTRIEDEIPLHFDNSLAVLLGAEYMVTEVVAARGGYHAATMVTPERYGGAAVNDSVNTPSGRYSGGYVLIGASFTYRKLRKQGAQAGS